MSLVLKHVFYLFLVFFLILSGGLVMQSLEGWSFIEGLFWAFETSTTIGTAANHQVSPFALASACFDTTDSATSAHHHHHHHHHHHQKSRDYFITLN
jgi:hypothetical protein